MEMVDIFAQPRVIEDIEECYFYHTIDIPGHGTIKGNWDLRKGLKEYLGEVDFLGKRILDVGTANGKVPVWLTPIIGALQCNIKRVSKYCIGIEKASSTVETAGYANFNNGRTAFRGYSWVA